jgi:hypothetical protein
MNFELQIDQTMMNQVKISRLFQMDFLIVIGGTSYKFWIAN